MFKQYKIINIPPYQGENMIKKNVTTPVGLSPILFFYILNNNLYEVSFFFESIRKITMNSIIKTYDTANGKLHHVLISAHVEKSTAFDDTNGQILYPTELDNNLYMENTLLSAFTLLCIKQNFVFELDKDLKLLPDETTLGWFERLFKVDLSQELIVFDKIFTDKLTLNIGRFSVIVLHGFLYEEQQPEKFNQILKSGLVSDFQVAILRQENSHNLPIMALQAVTIGLTTNLRPEFLWLRQKVMPSMTAENLSSCAHFLLELNS